MTHEAASANSVVHTILDRVHVRIAETEMMADLVDDDMADQFFEPDAGLLHFGEQRAAIEGNIVPLPAWRRPLRFLPDRYALIQAGQLIATGHSEMVQNLLRRPVLDPQHDVAEMSGERCRDGFEHAPGDGFEIGDGGWVGHARDMGVAVLRRKAVSAKRSKLDIFGHGFLK